MKLLIVQISPSRTASTLLVNALYGMIPELSDHRCAYVKKDAVNQPQDIIKEFEPQFNDVILIKVHTQNMPISEFRRRYTGKYNLLFICSQRKELNLYMPYNAPDVVVFDYEELNETATNPLPKIIDTIHNRIEPVLPIKLDKASGFARVVAMNARYKEIEHLPFRVCDGFFQIHGSHRNRGKRLNALPKKGIP